MERWYFLIGSVIVCTFIWLYQYKVYKDNKNKKKIKLSFQAAILWRTKEFNQKDGRMFLEITLVIMTIAFVGFNFIVLLFCLGFVKPIYETSSGAVLKINEVNGKEYVDYDNQKNVEIIRVEKGASCEGKISSSNTINFCKGDWSCVKNQNQTFYDSGTCQCEKGTSSGCKYDFIFDQVKKVLTQ